jgi:hypothetical protein
MAEENCLDKRYIIGIDSVPKMNGMIRRSLSGFSKGYKRWVKMKKRGGCR